MTMVKLRFLNISAQHHRKVCILAHYPPKHWSIMGGGLFVPHSYTYNFTMTRQSQLTPIPKMANILVSFIAFLFTFTNIFKIVCLAK